MFNTRPLYINIRHACHRSIDRRPLGDGRHNDGISRPHLAQKPRRRGAQVRYGVSCCNIIIISTNLCLQLIRLHQLQTIKLLLYGYCLTHVKLFAKPTQHLHEKQVAAQHEKEDHQQTLRLQMARMRKVATG